MVKSSSVAGKQTRRSANPWDALNAEIVACERCERLRKYCLNVAREKKVDLSETMLFFYEVHELEFDQGKWSRFEPEPSFVTNVKVPENKVLEGYDVVTFFVRSSPECSPLSCNGLADEVETNSHCLLESLEQAQGHLENGTFNNSNSEPGPYRIFAVYSVVGWSAASRATARCSPAPLRFFSKLS